MFGYAFEIIIDMRECELEKVVNHMINSSTLKNDIKQIKAEELNCKYDKTVMPVSGIIVKEIFEENKYVKVTGKTFGPIEQTLNLTNCGEALSLSEIVELLKLTTYIKSFNINFNYADDIVINLNPVSM